jgi:hypothetical protein
MVLHVALKVHFQRVDSKRNLLYNCCDISIKLNSVALVRERTVPTERPPLVGEVNANFCG